MHNPYVFSCMIRYNFGVTVIFIFLNQ